MEDIHWYLLVIMFSVYRYFVAVLLFSDRGIGGVPPEGSYAHRECILRLESLSVGSVNSNRRIHTCAPLNSMVVLTD